MNGKIMDKIKSMHGNSKWNDKLKPKPDRNYEVELENATESQAFAYNRGTAFSKVWMLQHYISQMWFL